ncbi:Hint domain-containing protein [Acetobacter malorum]|uniref:Hint domain-containing protein n=1 Tax=Acetobacter malorum TaxID=178901 RepID=UPI0009EECDE5|nr:Hint domain-containing protein [Acetobacter malorum]
MNNHSPSYKNTDTDKTDLHQYLTDIALEAESAGGDTSQYTTQGSGYHAHDANWRWTGPATGGDWSDPANWTLYNNENQPVPASEIPTGGAPAIPQSEQNADVNVGYYDGKTPSVVVANAPYYNQIRSLSVWQNSTLKITAQYQNGDSNGYVFATAGLENFGSIIVDTPAKVELGGINVQAGTLTILNNHGNVIFDNDQINNGGTINLINASLGTPSNPITVSGGTVNLQQNSSILANLWGEGGAINVDPDSVNTIYINDRYSNNDGNKQNTVINGVSENTHFGLLGTSSAPVAATYSLNDDGSYTLTVHLADDRSIAYTHVNMAAGYTPPAQITIVQDGTTGWLLEDTAHSTVPSYSANDLHTSLAAIATDANSAGGDTSQYTTQGSGYHAHDANWRWTGPATGGDWSDPANWTLYNNENQPVPASEIPTGGAPAIPQSEQNADVNVGYYDGKTPSVVVANAPYYNQIRSLSVWQNSTLKITAQYQNGDSNGYVFATAGLENFGSIIVDTPAKVELGGINVQAGTLTILNNHGNVIFNNDQINNGGTINLINASLGTPSNPITVSGGTVNLQQNSSILANLWGEGGAINVDPDSVNTIYINDRYSNNDGNKQNTVINGVSGNTHFGVLGTSSKPVSASYAQNSDGSYCLTVKLTDGRSISYPEVNMTPGYTPPAEVTIIQDGTTGWLLTDTTPAACFLPGVKIRTTAGDVAVENIHTGDKILVRVDGLDCERSVVWVGKSRKTVVNGLSDDEAGYPVRILKNALADGVPYQDMLITAEHCLFLEGYFVPVRMLVNGKSIFYDHSITSYDYYHIETEKHSVLIADGALTESYLDTGNRSSFVSDGNIVVLHSHAKSWDKDAAAPLEVKTEFVECLFKALTQRASEVENSRNSTLPLQITHDHALYLVTNSGCMIHPVRQTGNQTLSFMIPPGTTKVHLTSRSSRPSDVIGPFINDRRTLGVLVGRVMMLTANGMEEIMTHLEDAHLIGWHTMEQGTTRWTNGNAILPLGNKPTQGVSMLTLQIMAAGPYELSRQVMINERKTA